MAIKWRLILLMGVSGSGKTTVGRLLAERLGWEFWDGDDFHPPANVRKMASGKPLDEEDRRPWLLRLRQLVDEVLSHRCGPAILACSALRRTYRDLLLPADSKAAVLVFLKGERNTIRKRLQARSSHFMPPDLLDSQFETLEEPRTGVIIDVGPSPSEIVEAILLQLQDPQSG